MPLRCIAFLPLAAIVTGLILLLTSSLVSGLESTLVVSSSNRVFEVVRYETECELLERRIEEVARDIRSCEALPGCLQTKNLCPTGFREELMLEWERLRLGVQSGCTGLPTYATRVSTTCSSSGSDCSTGLCLSADEDGEDTLATPPPDVFLF